MSVTVDQEMLPAEELGLNTVGQVLAHVQRTDRLVINLLIDGLEPDLAQIGMIRQRTLGGHTLFIETAERREMALEVLDEVEQQLALADDLKSQTTALLQRNQPSKAMEQLSGCFAAWKAAQESVLKTAQLLKIDLARLHADDRTLVEMLESFTAQLRQIKSTLEDRDFVALADILTYETAETSGQWQSVLTSLRAAIG